MGMHIALEEWPGKLKAVDWLTYHATFPKSKPGRGILEVFAQSATLHSSNSDGLRESRNMKFVPMIMSRANSSVTFSAVEMASQHLSVSALNELAQRLRVIILCEVPDNHTVNLRKKAYTATLLADNILMPPHNCCVHSLQRTLTSSFDMTKLAGDVHAVHMTTRNPGHAQRLAAAALALLDEEFLVLPGPPPNETWRATTEAIMQHTILRCVDITSGCLVVQKLVYANACLGRHRETHRCTDAQTH
jgi:hypothetical protein